MNTDKEKQNLCLTVLGARGSMPGEGRDFEIFGGSTSCYRIRAGNEEIYLDAGSGIAGAIPEQNTNITVLLTHMHLDHLVGLPFFSALTHKDRHIDIYGLPRDGLTPQEAVDRLITPPFWPVKIADYPANVKFHLLSDSTFFLGNVSVDMMEGNHPGGSTIFRLTYGEKSIVYATDFEHLVASECDALADFSHETSLLLYDAQYTQEEYAKYKGYGHSTPEMGMEIFANSKAKKLLMVHHAPWRKDEEILRIEENFKRENVNIAFAKIGDEFIL